jgi:hypothetical protein
VLVCGGVLLIPAKEKQQGKFHLPYINGRIGFPLLVVASMLLVTYQSPDYWISLFYFDFTSNTDYITGKLSFFDVATPQISLIIFWSVIVILSIFSFFRRYSLIPLLGLSSCLYLLTGMTKSNWVWFLGWLLLGLVIYFMYGFKNSKLNKDSMASKERGN